MLKRFMWIAVVCAGAAAAGAELTMEIATVSGRMRSEQAKLVVTNGAAEFRLKKEVLTPDVKRVRLKPDFARAKAGEEGYWINPSGELGTFKARGTNLTRRVGRPHMPFFGMKTPRGAWVAIVKGQPWNFSLTAELKEDVYTLSPCFDLNTARAGEDIVVEFRWLAAPDDTYSGMAKAYRAWQLGRGEVKPLKERIKEQPLLDYMTRWPEVRVRQAWKPVPSPVPEQTVKDEPPVKPVITFERFMRIADEFKKQGIGGAEFCLVGWNAGGHDGRWPQIFPVEPTLGGEAKLREAVAHAQVRVFEAYPESDPSWFGFLMTVRPDAGFTRNDLAQHLEARNIQTRNLFAGNILKHPCFESLREGVDYRVVGDLVHTDTLMNDALWIGLYPGMTDAKLDWMIASVRDIVKQ